MSTSHSKILIGVATLPERRDFFENKCLPSLQEQADEVVVYHDLTLSGDINFNYHSKTARIFSERYSLGDAGKFLGFPRRRKEGPCYFFTCDDDLIYPPDYCERMIEWIEYYNREAVVSLHGSFFEEFPIQSYYLNRRTFFCLKDLNNPQQILFPGTGVSAFHSSTVQPDMRWFKTRNMADVWFGICLQQEEIPAICIPHSEDYLTYNKDLPLEDTIWGKMNRNDFIQTALINQFSLDQGFQFFPVPHSSEESDSPPRPLSHAPEPLQ